MKTKRYFRILILAMAVSGMCLQSLAGAQETSQPQQTYSSLAKVEQAVRGAKQGANTADPSLHAALSQVEKADAQMVKTQMSGNPQQRMSAEMVLNNAEDNYVGMLSRMSGVPQKDISDMHTAGMGWADVASDLGIQGMTGRRANNDKGNSSGMADHDSGMSGSMGAGMGSGGGSGMH